MRLKHLTLPLRTSLNKPSLAKSPSTARGQQRTFAVACSSPPPRLDASNACWGHREIGLVERFEGTRSV